MAWTDFKPFSEHFQVKHYVGHAGRRGKWTTTLEGCTGYLSQSEGLFPIDGGLFDYRKLNRDNIPVGVYWIRIHSDKKYYDYIGRSSAGGNYSKMQHGIFGRVADHYRKIIHLPDRGKIGKYIKEKSGLDTREECIERFKSARFDNYEELRNYFTDDSGKSFIKRDIPEPFQKMHEKIQYSLQDIKSIKKFFEENVEFRYHYIQTRSDKDIAKAEGLALREYFYRYGKKYPFLNTRDETRGLDGF